LFEFTSLILSYAILGIWWERKGLHCHTGSHCKHSGGFLEDGLAGALSHYRHDHQYWRKKWGLAISTHHMQLYSH